MNNKDSLGDRMRKYESITDNRLISLSPVIIRLDGRYFHSLTKKLEKPYDDIFIELMNTTAKTLCEEIQNCRLAYVQSDEISLVLLEKNYLSEPWFDNRLNKILSISSSIATKAFTLAMLNPIYGNLPYNEKYKRLFREGMFDSRAFNLSREEVVNYLIWRQNDCIRNAKNMYAETYLSSKKLHGKSSEERIVLADQISNLNFYEDIPIRFQRGRCIVKEDTENKSSWIVDNSIPVFKDDKEYILERLKEEVI